MQVLKFNTEAETAAKVVELTIEGNALCDHGQGGNCNHLKTETMKKEAMDITAIFFTTKNVWGGRDVLVKHEINTGKNTIEEAFDVAVANGADPMKRIEFRR